MDYDTILKTIRLNMRSLRKKKFPNYSFNAVGYEAKMRGTDWQKIENGTKDPTLKVLNRIAKSLGVTLGALIFSGSLCSECEERIKRIRTKK